VLVAAPVGVSVERAIVRHQAGQAQGVHHRGARPEVCPPRATHARGVGDVRGEQTLLLEYQVERPRGQGLLALFFFFSSTLSCLSRTHHEGIPLHIASNAEVKLKWSYC